MGAQHAVMAIQSFKQGRQCVRAIGDLWMAIQVFLPEAKVCSRSHSC